MRIVLGFYFVIALFGAVPAQGGPSFNPEVDYYKILGVQSTDDRTTIRKAYLQKVRPLWENGTVTSEANNASLKSLNEAYEVLKDTDGKKAQYDEMRSQVKNGTWHGYASSPTERTPVYDTRLGIVETPSGEKAYHLGGAVFNRSKPIEYWRGQPDHNSLAAMPEERRSVDSKSDARSLAKKWKTWNGDLSQIKAEMTRLASSEELTDDNRAFLHWWFGRRESHASPEIIQNALDSATHPDFVQEIATSSLAEPTWRKPAWVSELLTYPDTMGPIVEAMTQPELVGNESLFQQVADMPEFIRSHYTAYCELLLPKPESTKYGDRFLKIMSAAPKYGPSFFLNSGGGMPQWIRNRPDVVQYAIGRVRTTRLNEEVIGRVLSRPESADHLEWLEYVIKTPDPYNFHESALNRLLAADHWYNHPGLRKILNGASFTVTNLRAKNWRPGGAVIRCMETRLLGRPH